MRTILRALGFGLLLCGAVASAPTRGSAAETMTMDVCPNDYSGFPADGPTLDCGCTADALKAGDVFGANPFYWQSSVCRAAAHAGLVGPQGGRVTVTPGGTVPVYPGVTRNGIVGRSWHGGAGNQGFQLSAGPGTPGQTAPASPPVQAGSMTLDTCPNDYSGFGADSPSLTCTCPAQAGKAGDVFGANPYYWQSSVCRAAIHAGVLGEQGGQVKVLPSPAVPVYPGVARNGVSGRSWTGGASNQGFVLAGADGTAPPPTVSHVDQTEAGLMLDTCPSDYSSFPADAPPVTCGCSPAALKQGDVFGANPYYWQSSVCRAAVHAGVIGPKGARVVVTPATSPVFPSVTRNGIAGRSWAGGAANQGFRVAAADADQPKTTVAKPTVDGAGQPVQAPVAQTLRETGQVALYVRFRFNSADLDIASAPTLMQLRDALVAAPGLRLLLVGHTDAVGGRDYNRDLSLKRAQAVMLWLRDQGIPPTSLAIDGKGFDEPVAGNDTDGGRALNRRVQAIRIP